MAAREGEPGAFTAAGVPELRLEGLPPAACAVLLRKRAGRGVAGDVVERVCSATAGNPLAVCELAKLLSSDQLAGFEPLDDPLPVGRDIERAFRRRIVSLPAPTQRGLVVAAASETRALDEIARALDALGLRLEALEAAEEAGLVTMDRGELEFASAAALVRLSRGVSF